MNRISTSPLVTCRIPYAPNPPRVEPEPSPEPLAHPFVPSRIDKTPEIPARSRSPSLDSPLELPPSADIIPLSPNVIARRPPRSEHGPVLTLLGTFGQIRSIRSLPHTPEEPALNVGSSSRPCLSKRSVQSQGPGHPVSLFVSLELSRLLFVLTMFLDISGLGLMKPTPAATMFSTWMVSGWLTGLLTAAPSFYASDISVRLLGGTTIPLL
ncbi:hypothetical protein GGR53DRAFT_20446 [Hypoxylon sp. FL1150]|nr:hypothetical protein GGR53DRAFT_20446 [Hypoxylon sp. FL1150]